MKKAIGFITIVSLSVPTLSNAMDISGVNPGSYHSESELNNIIKGLSKERSSEPSTADIRRDWQHSNIATIPYIFYESDGYSNTTLSLRINPESGLYFIDKISKYGKVKNTLFLEDLQTAINKKFGEKLTPIESLKYQVQHHEIRLFLKNGELGTEQDYNDCTAVTPESILDINTEEPSPLPSKCGTLVNFVAGTDPEIINGKDILLVTDYQISVQDLRASWDLYLSTRNFIINENEKHINQLKQSSQPPEI